MKKTILALAAFFALPVFAHADAGFTTGLLLGSAMSSNSTTTISGGGSSTIPPRCYAALVKGEDDYKKCRRPSLRAELIGMSVIYKDSDSTPSAQCKFITQWGDEDGKLFSAKNYPADDCNIDLNLEWELEMLRAEAKSQKTQ